MTATTLLPADIKRYRMTYNDFDITVEIDHSMLTDADLYEINNFWSGSEDRLSDAGGSLRTAVLKMLCAEILRLTLTELDPIGAFDWKKKSGVEGWPAMDGSEGIKIIDYDELTIDNRDVTVQEITVQTGSPT